MLLPGGETRDAFQPVDRAALPTVTARGCRASLGEETNCFGRRAESSSPRIERAYGRIQRRLVEFQCPPGNLRLWGYSSAGRAHRSQR